MDSQSAARTGGYIDAFCTKCDMLLGHTVIAMVGAKVVKVKCNTCGADHSYRGELSPAKAKAVAAQKKAGPTWEQRMKGKDIANARKYSAKDHFQVNDVIAHPTFGLGVVIANRSGKIDVSFKAFDKTLVNGKAA